MKTRISNSKVLLKSFSLVCILIALSACQSESTDLYKADSPDLKSELKEITPADTTAPTPGIKIENAPELFETGEVLHIEVSSPDGLELPESAKLRKLEQVISLQNNEVKPKLDLLFVIDDSNSMEPHHANLSAAMEDFKIELSKLNLLDYRIAATTIYDSKRYFKQGKPGDDRYEQGVTEWSREEQGQTNYVEKRNFYRLGRLLPLKDATSGSLNFEQRFATPETNLEDLAATLKIGAKPWQEYDEYSYLSKKPGSVPRPPARPSEGDSISRGSLTNEVLTTEAKGPRFEELLSPMIAALNPAYLIFGGSASHYRAQYPQTGESNTDQWNPPSSDDPAKEEKWMEFAKNYNGSFVREGAHLGVIFVSDTVDQSVDINPKAAAEALAQLKGDDGSFSKVSTYGVLHKNTVSFDLQNKYSEVWSKRHCTANNRVDDDVYSRNGYDRPQKLEAFLRLTSGSSTPEGSNILNICNDDYGAQLAKVGKDLFNKSVSRGEYDLTERPAGTVEVYFKDEPDKKVPVCGNDESQQLCWSLQFKRGVNKILLFNQANLGQKELVVSYEVVDPQTANSLNSRAIGGN